MKKILKISVLLLAAVLIFGFTGCGGEEDEVSFDSFSPYSILVENKSSKKLVAFRGSLNPNFLIGGIPAYAINHGLEKKSSLFDKTGDFPLILITEEDYKNNKTNLSSAPIFATIYAFYNHEASNNNVFIISGLAGGNARLTLNNPETWNIEIRKDGPTGEVLGYVASTMNNTVLRLQPDDYLLFPVFNKYIEADKQIYTAVPTFQDGEIMGLPYFEYFTFPPNALNQTWPLGNIKNLASLRYTSGTFYIRIINSAGTAFQFQRGGVDQVTSTGLKGILRTTSNTYSIRMERDTVDNTFKTPVTMSGFSVGGGFNFVDLPEREYHIDRIYTFRVTGSTMSTLSVAFESDDPIDIDAMFR